METPLQTKSVNALFAFLKTTLFTVEQMIATFFSSKTTTRLSLIPIKEDSLNQSNFTKRPLNGYMAMVLLLLSLFFVGNAFGQSPYTSVASGNWNSDATWSGSGIPIAGSVVNIANGHTITVTAAAAATSITFTGASATLSVNSTFTLAVSGAVTLNNSASQNQAATISGAGTLNCASFTVGGTTTILSDDQTTIATSTISNLNITGNLNINGEDDGSDDNDATFNLQSGVVTVGGTINTDEESGSIVTLSLNTGLQSGTLIVSGATPFTDIVGTPTINANGTTATVNYSGANQTVRALTYTNLTLSGSGVKTFSSTSTINTLLSIQGTATVAGTTPTYSTATLEYKGGSAQTTSNVEFPSTITVDLIINNSNGVTLNSNKSAFSGSLTVTAGSILALSTFNLASPSSLSLECGATTGSSLTGSGTLTLGGDVTVTNAGTGTNGATIASRIAMASTRTFNIANDGSAASDFTINGIVSGSGAIIKAGLGSIVLSGTNTYSGGTTINAGILSINSTTALGAATNNLTIASGAVANVAANVTVGNLTLGGAGTASGTWGFTGSGATYINTTYFTSTSRITVSNNTSITPTVTVTPIGTYTYNGASQGPIAATNTGPGTSYTFSYVGVSGTTYLANATPPTNAGSYTVTATVAAVTGFSSAASSSATPFTIGAKVLTIGSPTIASKAYDATTTAGAVTLGSLSGFIGSQTVTATATAANYSSANVNSYSGVVITYTLVDGTNGGLATNYSLANGSATGVITAKVLTIGAPTIASKAYDATTTAGAVTVGTLSGFIGSQTVTATATAANYSSANVNSYAGVIISYTLANGLNGGLATNYSLANGSATGVITAKALTIGTPTIVSKTYDGTTTAGSVTEGALSGFIGTQTVIATGTGANYSSANVGSYPGVVISYTLANGLNGGLATNYSLANGSATGAITAKALTIGSPTIASKIYDGNTTAGAVTVGSLSGFIGSETVTTTATAANYSSANVNSYSGVVITYTLANGLNGGLATNYSLANGTATGVITPGPFVKMQILLPGESNAPGTPSGKTGTPNSQISGVAFTATVHAVDAFWNIVPTAPANIIAITTSDVNDTHPATNTLSSGTRTFSITLKTVGSSTVTATNSSDGSKTANTSPSVTVTPGIKTTAQDGNWNDPNTWFPVGVPYFSDQVYIVGSDDVIVTANATCASINFTDENSSLSVNSGIILTVSGAVTLDSYNDDTDTSAEILGDGTLNADSLNVGLASILNNNDGSDNTLDITIDTMNISGDITMYNNDEGGGDANRPGLYINSPSVLSASRVAMIQTGNGGGGSRIITFDVDNGATVNLSGGPNPITISSEVDLDSDHVNFDFDTSSTINFNGSVTQNIPASISNSRIGGDTDDPVIVNYGNLSINNNTGTTTSAATGRTINVAGNWTNNGLFAATSSTVNFIGNANEAITGTTVTTFDDVTIAKTGGTLSVNTNAIVGDDLTFTASSATLSVPSPRVLTVTDRLTLNNDDDNSVSATISGTGSLTASTVVVGPSLSPNNNSSRTTTLTSSISSFTIANDLEINSYYSNGSRRNNGVFNHASGILTINGEINTTNQNSGNVSTFSMTTVPQLGLLKLAGAAPFNLSPTGTNTINLNGSGAVVEYLGSVPQTALGTTYRTLIINNSNTGVTLSGSASATTLDLTDGLVTTGTNTMTVVSGGSISNASATTYVNGKLARVITTTNPTTFPVGKGGVYRPVDFTYAAAPGTKTVTVEQFETVAPFPNSASFATFGNRYWNITQSATGVAYRVGLNDGGNSGSVPSGSSVVIVRKDNGIISTNASSYSAPNYTNVTSFANTSGIFTNDVALGVNNIPLSITGVSGINTKIYNGNTIATAIGTPTLTGSISPGDIVTLSGTAVYTFDTKNVGTGKAVTVSGLTLSGANASGYTLPSPNQIPGLTADITVRPITVTANTNTKIFDNFATSATLPSITSGALQGTDTFGFIQTYDNKNAGTNKTLTPSGIVNDGNSGNNYAVTLVENYTGVINAKTLTIATPTTVNKVYDGTNVASTTSGSWALTGVISPNDVTLNKSAVFASKDFGTWAITSTSTLSGADADNYLLIQPTLTSRTISKAVLTITGTTTVDKEYDRTNTAVLSDGILNGVVSGEDVTLVLSGRYASANAGGPYAMTSTSTIVGADISNYTLTQPTLTPRSISKVTLTVIGANSADKAYNGNTIAIVTDGSLVGVVPGDVVSLTQSGIFPSKDVGGPYSITPNFSIGGSPAANYILTQPILADASITPKALTISGTSQNKVYDGTSEATLTGIGAGVLNGVVAGESVLLDLIVNYYSSPGVTVKDAGSPYFVVSTSTISSGNIATDLANYTLIQPTLTTRSITKIPLTITGTTTVDKEYDRTNTALLTDGVLNGVLLGEDVSLVLSGRYASANAGGPYIMTSTSTLIGSDIANYTLVQPSTLTPRSISKVTLTIDGATTIDKDYNGNTNAVVIGGSLVGIVPGDVLSLTQAGIYPTKDVGGPYAITPNFSIGGVASINYDLIQPPLSDASINLRALTIIGTTQNKVYDGTDTATLIGGGLSGVVSGEDVVLNFVANYSSKDAGGPYTITSNSSISGSDIGNYTFIQPTVLTPARSITKIPMTVTGVSASDKVYDGNRTAVIDTNLAVLNGTILPGETVTLNTTGATATFDTRDVGIGKTITGANFILDGTDAINYTVIQPTMTADITARTLTITANDISKCAESTYNFTGTEFTRDYLVPGDVTSVTLSSAGADISATAGTYPIVASNAIGSGIDNYDIVYVSGNLVVNPLPTGTIFVPSSSCAAEQARVTFTGSNGSGIERYRFYYTINGVLQTVTTLPGNNIATIVVPTNLVTTLVYALTKVEDVNTGCSSDITPISFNLVVGSCTQIRGILCGKTLPELHTRIQASPLPGVTQYRFEVIRTDDPLDSRIVNTSSYLFNPASQLSGGLIYGKAYAIRVKTFVGATENPWGPICIVTAPSEPACCTITKLRSIFCGKTMQFMTRPIEASPVYLATTYEFEVSSGAGTFVISSSNYKLNLFNAVPGGALYNTGYTIRVRSKGDATAFTAWGDPCVVTTPMARMSERIEDDSIFNVKAFPNPFASHFSLDIESSSDEQVEMKVYDMIGRQLEASKATVSELSTREIGRNYPSGVYNVLVTQGNKVKSVRMVKR